MKISYSWIKEFVDIDADAPAAADALTMSGIEVEEVSRSTIPRQVVCARILKVKPHPNADKLSLCLVDAGKEPVWVVCGAPNVRPGLMSAYAPEGADLGNGIVVRKTKIKGEVSVGVLLSERELGLTDDHTAIMELEGNVKPGESFVQNLGLEDWVLNINVTPNRGDCLSVIGIARELAAIFKKDFRLEPVQLADEEEPIENLLSVEVIAREACPRYCARVLKGVKIRKSPFALRRRLFQSGVRAINNVVDITNYVMLELGQPLHAFDYRQIGGQAIIVRKAKAAERFVTLDEVERVLAGEDLLICDREKPVALAGIMGGLNSEVADDTETVVLESAFFEPLGNRRTSRRLNLSTEASYRFERGVDPGIQALAADRASELMCDLADARICRGIIDADYRQHIQRDIPLRRAYMAKVLGLGEISGRVVDEIFFRLGCSIKPTAEGWMISPPSFRHDLEREIDLIEEFIRIYGMDKVAPELPTFRPEATPAVEVCLKDIRIRLAAMGLTEIVTYAFISPVWKKWFAGEALELRNPISDEMRIMRTSLIPGLVTTVAKNKNLQTRDIALFELGRCFFPEGEGLPVEKERLGIAISGQRRDTHWSEQRAQVDFYDLKGIAETLFPGLELTSSLYPFFQPGFQANIILDAETTGYLGLISEDIRESLDIPDEVYVMEVAVHPLLDRQWKGLSPIPRFPMTWRDMSLIVDEATPYADIERTIVSQEIRELRRALPIDVYVGEKLPEGKKGITIRIIYQSDERTLEDRQINAWQEIILNALQKGLGISLRQ